MGSSATGICIPQKSKKRVFPGSSPDGGPVNPKNKILKQNEDAMVVTSSGTVDAVRSSEQVKPDKKEKGVVISSTLGDAIDIDSDDDSCYGKDYTNLSSEESESEDDYAVLQSRFDNIDLPTGVEAAIPHFSDSIKMKNKMKVNGSKTSAGSGLRVQRGAMKVHAEPANGSKTSAGSGLR